jgi:Ca2+-binding RTX toxin-like protein
MPGGKPLFSAALGAALVLSWAPLAAAQTAPTTCTFDPASGVVTVVTDSSDLLAIGRTAEGSLRISFGPESNLLDCGAADVSNSETVAVNATAEISLTMDLRTGPFGPGRTPEADGDSEIEVEVTGPANGGGILGSPGDDSFSVGLDGMSLNADGDLDVSLTDVEPAFVVYGNDGHDSIDASDLGSEAFNRLDGGAGHDSLTGSDGEDTILGGDGSDWLVGNGEDDDIDGGPGDDRILEGAVTNGPDRIAGGAGFDRLSYGERTGAVTATPDGLANDGEAGEGDNVAADIEAIRLPSTTAPSCTYDPVTGDVVVEYGYSDETLGVTRQQGSELLEVGGLDCGEASVVNTDRIVINAEWTDSMFIDLEEGPLGPGRTPEPDGISEIEIEVSTHIDSTWVRGTAGDDTFTALPNGLALNADADPDLSYAGPVPVFRFVNLYGEAGNDTLDASRVEGLGVVALGGDAGDDVLTGSPLWDQIYTGTGNDVVHAGGGDDEIWSAFGWGEEGQGTAVIDAGDGDDVVTARGASVEVDGGAGNDTISGTDGNDVIVGGLGDDTLDGAGGNDTFDEGDAPSGADAIGGGAGTDVVDYTARAWPVAATLDGVADDGAPGEGDNLAADVESAELPHEPAFWCRYDALTGDLFVRKHTSGSFSIGRQPGSELLQIGTLDCGEASVTNTDRIVVEAESFELLHVDLRNGPLSPGRTPEGEGISEIEIEVSSHPESAWIDGTPEDDTVTVLPAGLALNADGDEDVSFADSAPVTRTVAIFGDDGNDSLDASVVEGLGFVVLGGGAGNDQLIGSAVRDEISTGSGIDVVHAGGGEDEIESPGSPFANGTGTADIDAGDGDDVVTARGASVEVDGGAGDDTISGTEGNDVIVGGLGDDTLDGRGGNDTFDEGDAPTGADAIGGGAGTDVVDYSARALPVAATFDGMADDGAPGEGDNLAADVESAELPDEPPPPPPVDPLEALVGAYYADFLDRPADAGGLAHWVGLLESGMTRGSVADEFARSPEWVATVVNRMYEDTLGRPADADGAAYWIAVLRSGQLSVADVAASFYASPEYFARAGGSVEAWVGDLYEKLLHRGADQGGIAYWTAETAASGRTSVAAAFFQSLESRQDRVAALYEKFLRRGPDTAGLGFWAGVILVDGDIALAKHLAASDEYFARVSAG